MRFLLQFIVVVSIAGTIFCSNATATSFNASDYEWDYLVLSLRWSHPECGYHILNDTAEVDIDTHVICPDVSCTGGRWVIHGLWPTKNGTDGPNYCLEQAKATQIWNDFQISQNSTLYSQLLIQWPDLLAVNGSSSEGFWKYEWLKHGTCALGFPPLDTIEEYLATAIQLKNRLDMVAISSAAGMVPGCVRQYAESSIVGFFETSFNKKVCLHFKYRKSANVRYIAEVGICFGLDFNTVDCPQEQIKSSSGM